MPLAPVCKTRVYAAFFFALALVSGPATTGQTFLCSAEEKEQTKFAPEYPADPPVDVCPTELVGYRLVKTFDFTTSDATLDGWEGLDDVSLSRQARALAVEMKMVDPYFFSPELDDLPKGSLLVRFRARRTNKGDGQLFFETEKHSYSEAHTARFKLANDDEFHDYVVLLESAEKIRRVRFDLGEDEGIAEIERVEFFETIAKPVKFGVATLDSGALAFDLVNAEPAVKQIAEIEYYGFDDRENDAKATVEFAENATLERRYPQRRPFEELEVVAKIRSTDETINRRYFAFNESACASAPGPFVQGEAPTLRCGKLAVRFARDASGAEIFRDGVRVAVLAPLAYEEGDGAAIVPPKHDFAKELETASENCGASPPSACPDVPPRSSFFYEDFLRSISNLRLTPVFHSLSDDGREIVFALCAIPPEKSREILDAAASGSTPVKRAADADSDSSPDVENNQNLLLAVGSLKFRLDEETLSFEFDSPRKIHAPVLRVLGTMRQATLPGVEYLEEGEHSSSTADIKTPEHVRYAPSCYWITQPYAAIATERASLVLTYDDPKAQPVFAVPDFVDGDATTSRMNVCATSAAGKIRVAPPAPLEDAILWAVRNLGLPEPPTPPRSPQEQQDLILAALEKSIIVTPEGWSHALFNRRRPYLTKPNYGADFVSTIWEITGRLPETPRLDFCSGHIPNYAAFFLTGQGERVAADLKNVAALRARQMQDDGSFRYYGEYLWGNRTDYASGDCGTRLYELGWVWSFTGNKNALAALVKGCDFMNALLTPRGAQTWELSLHTPDIVASARCCMANVWAYEGTGDRKYLDAARRWAITGLPFVYLWEDPTLEPESPTENADVHYQPIMKYSTIAVFGATIWIYPNWMGRPVQWCGLDYAHALILLAKHDDALDWRKIAEGIVVSAECQLCVEGELVGLLPDWIQLETQDRRGPFTNPCAVHMLRRMLDGEPTNLSVVDLDGKRVAAPFPTRVEDGAVKISAKKGLVYQIMIDGEEIRTIESQGEDVLRF